METKVNYTLAGAFILVLLTFIILGIIWLSAGLSADEFKYYKVFMKESVSGLTLESPVEFNGVNVGTIEEMKINRKNVQLVELLLKVKRDTPVTFGTRAKLGVRALTGVGYILLEDKGANMKLLKRKPGQKYAVIETTPSVLVRLDTTLTQINKSFEKLSQSIDSLLDKENLAWIKQILLSGQNSLRLLETKTIPATTDTFVNLDTITRNLTSVSSEIKQNPAVLIRGKADPGKLGPGEK